MRGYEFLNFVEESFSIFSFRVATDYFKQVKCMRKSTASGMALCLNYQAVYVRRGAAVASTRMHVIGAVALLAALAVKVWIKLESTDLGYVLARERQRTVDLDMERREMELQRSVLLRPDNLTKAAREKLGLSEHDLTRTITISY